MNIDWSKAPDWATGYATAEQYSFWVNEEFYAYTVRPEHKYNWYPRPGSLAFRHQSEMESLVPRPLTWDGSGLPPAGTGTVCEFRSLAGSENEWVKVDIVGVFNASDCMVAAYVPVHGCRKVNQAIAECFRPARTAEQIAAEEKQNAWLAGIAAEYDQETADKCAAVLVAGGYRKQEQR